MTAGDAGEVAELYTQLGYPFSATQITRRFHRIAGPSDHTLFVAQLAGGPVAGWI